MCEDRIKSIFESKLPAVIDFDQYGKRFKVSEYTWPKTSAKHPSPCPETHFVCPGDDILCLPVFVLCNGVYDCSGHEDESDCGSHFCPGFYRCRGSAVCLHPLHVCDNVFQCPQQDDELLCNATCPETCTCNGLSFSCSGSYVPARDYPLLRYLDASSSGLNLHHFAHNHLMLYLVLAKCNIRHFHNLTLRNLRTLDVSDNLIHEIKLSSLDHAANLRQLNLAGNPLTLMFQPETDKDRLFPELRVLDVSGITLHQIDAKLMNVFPNLQILNLSGCGVQTATENGFQRMKTLRVLDIRGNPFSAVSGHTLRGLPNLVSVYADNHRLCCSQILPERFNPSGCQSPTDDVSSCGNLLGSQVQQISVAVHASVSLVANVVSFVLRVFFLKSAGTSHVAIFITHLSTCDCLGGVYLVIVGVADRIYSGRYVLEDTDWRHGFTCQLAGVVWTVSSQVATFIVFLLTAAQWLTSFSVKLSSRAVHCTCYMAWVVAVVVAVIPLLSTTHFYAQAAICIPFSFSSPYGFGVQIIVNSILCSLVFIACVHMAVVRDSIREVLLNEEGPKLTSVLEGMLVNSVVLWDTICCLVVILVSVLNHWLSAVPRHVELSTVRLLLPFRSSTHALLYAKSAFYVQRQQEQAARLKQRLRGMAKPPQAGR